MNHPSKPIRSLGVLLIPDFALLAYASAIEPFRAANRISGKPLYTWKHLSPDGRPVRASNGVEIVPDYGLGEAPPFDLLIICAGGNPSAFEDARTFAWLRQQARIGTRIAGVSGGPFVMARARLLDGYRCTIHWEHVSAFMEEFPAIELTGNLFELDRDRLSCSGGTASLDMMHRVIEEEHGHELASDIIDLFVHTNLRPGDGPQRVSVRERFAVGDPKLVKVLEAMEAKLEDPAGTNELARLAGVSTRQLERLFRRYLKRSIGEHYKELRLRRARILLTQSSLSVLQVAIACGFASAAHFSRVYKARFGRPPRNDLRRGLIGQAGRAG
jgi:transcriptional regulator GlxA family with amidase domain